MIIAHRGASNYAPENTMAAFRLALEMDSDGIELDLQLTKDGHVVICHDEELSRTTNGKGLIKDCTLDELRRLDAGSWYGESFAGERIPTLEEFLTLVCDTKLIVNLEIKHIPYYYEGIEEKIVQAIQRFGMVDRVIVSSFDHYALRKTAELNPDIELGLLFATRLIEPWRYAAGLPFAVRSMHPDYSFVDAEYIARCHEYGYAVYPYTANSPEWYKEMRRLGLDGVITNVPDVMK
ncbi:glycerophosphoryl diester phosphodiesterase [Paenibacillus tyrfis]|uniref:glycerophosphodiester phosphodiesterase n=1 Tax=Paenibacillus tyrfis TaxID=1501230 RepID=UPI0024935C4C|nr:glycerophosphodiester phosphodiesterase [Paenibacillus tyrfis]GLI06844.1 glycerophosphoryl diester phosphodiesterase [Paenibacillus tyrfis]